MSMDRGAEPGGVDDPRLDGARLAIETMRHELTDPLTVAAGFAELLAADADLPPHSRELAERCAEAIARAARGLRALERVGRLVETGQDHPFGPFIDLERSAR